MNDSDSEDISVDDEVESEAKAEDDKKNEVEKRKTKRQKKKEENECGLWAVYSGKRLSAVEKDLIENLPSDGVTGECRFSKSEKGYVNRDVRYLLMSSMI